MTLNLNPEQAIWAEMTVQKFEKKLSAVRLRSARKIPSRAVDGIHNDKGDSGSYLPDDGLCWWTNGFWAGMLWQAFRSTGEQPYAETARYPERRLDMCFDSYLGLHHDVGFMWLPSAVADYRLTGDADARRRGLHAANLLAGRFNPAGYIRAWNDIPGSSADTRGWAIIDCMFNIPLLYWASAETNDPRYAKIAVTHADTVVKHFVRPDGSVRHIVEFDPDTGVFVREHGGQGCSEGSSWTRGQAWGLYGFVISFRHTSSTRYLAMAQKIAEYFIAHIPQNGRIPVDFCQPPEPAWYDDIAAAVASCGLLELASLIPDKADGYLAPALKMMHCLEQSTDWASNTDGYLQNCSAAYHCDEHNINFTYGDYFFYEALLKLTGRGFFLW